MSKYAALWKHVAGCGGSTLVLSFDEIAQITGFPIDHSFLTFKKELEGSGWAVQKISAKAQTVRFVRTEPSNG